MEESSQNDDAHQRDSKGILGDVDSEISDVEGDSDEEEFHWEDEDEDGPILDANTLLQIKNNDPILTSIDVHCFDHCIDGEDAGHFIGKSSHLKKLLVKGESMEWDDRFIVRTACLLARFCRGIAQNHSVEHLQIRCCDLFVGDASVKDPKLTKIQTFIVMRLAHFFQHNVRLRSLKIECCCLRHKSTLVLALVLARKSNKSALQRIDLSSNEIDDDAAKELIESLNGYGSLVELSLGHNFIRVKGCAALEKLISSPTSNLKELDLQSNRIDDKAIAILTRSLAKNTSIKKVDLGDNYGVTDDGWQHFFTCLQNPSSSIEQLDLGANRIADQGIISLGNALAKNTTLECLDLSSSSSLQHFVPITADGWRSFFTSLRNSKSVVQDILLRGCGIDEEGLAILADALNNNSTLKILDLSKNPQVTAASWRRFFTACLRSPKSSLEGLFLCENLAEEADELMADLAGAIAHNDKLEAIDLGENPSITKTGWSHFSRLLCDKSSITSIYESNHTVNYFGPERLPLDLDDLVKLNEHENKKEVAREKILRHYFQDGANIQEFLDMKLKVLPHAMAWLGGESSWTGGKNTGRTPLYQLLRSLPSLFESQSSRLTGRKRKLRSLKDPTHARNIRSWYSP